MQPYQVSSPVIRFGVFEVDVRSGELRRSGVKVKIQDLPLRALQFLLSRPNEVLSREEFRRALWPDGVFVDFDHGISSAINRLRDALGDSADNPLFIETVERRGYRWIAPIQPPSVPAAEEKPITGAPKVAGVRWKWVLPLPAFLLLFVAWVLRPEFSAVKAGASTATAKVSPQGHQPNPQARDLYLQGRYYWNQRTPDGLHKALDYFTQAIVSDPGYAQAYVGLADSYNLLREYTLMPSTEAYPRALAAAKRAVELDDQNSEAHASVAFASFYGMWDGATAVPESLAEIERAQALDPTSKAILSDKGRILIGAGRREEAISLLKQMAAAEPEFVSPHRYLRYAYLLQGDYPDYLAEWKKEASLLQDKAMIALEDAAAKGYAAGGANGMLQNLLPLQEKYYRQGLVSPYCLAETYALMGNKEMAVRYLKTAYDNHDERILGLEGDTEFAPIQDEPTYRTVMAQLGFPIVKR